MKRFTRQSTLDSNNTKLATYVMVKTALREEAAAAAGPSARPAARLRPDSSRYRCLNQVPKYRGQDLAANVLRSWSFR